MRRAMMVIVLLGLSPAMASVCTLTDPNVSAGDPPADANSVEAVLDDLQTRATSLTSYQCKLDYVVRQPILESQSRRKGVMYYAKFDGRSYLRIDFNTLQYDEETEQEYREQYLFDGIWLTYISFEGRSVQRQQMAEPNEPVDAFALVSRRVPILGFSRIEDLRNQFDIKLIEPNEPGASSVWHLRMTVKPDSMYRDDYVTIDFEIDKQQGLPTKVTAVTTEQDIHEITLIDARINKGVPRSVFDVDIPGDFSMETIPLEKKDEPR